MSLKRIMVMLIFTLMMSFILTPTVYAASEDNITAVTIYYPNGDWKYVPTKLDVSLNDDPYLYALNQLVAGKNMPTGCYNEFPAGVQINSFKINDGIAYIDISESLVTNLISRNLTTDVVKDILSYNIFNLDENIVNISFTFNGITIKDFSSMDRKYYFGGELSSEVQIKVNEKTKALKEETKGMSLEQIVEYMKQKQFKQSTLSNFKVCIDPGHGGNDPGAVGTLNGVQYFEKNITLNIAQRLRQQLESSGFTVIMTRTSDTNPTLTQRVSIANNNNADAFVSVHINSSGNTSAKGTTCLYPNNHHIQESLDLANEVHDTVVSNTSLSQHRRPYIDDRNLAVLRTSKMPAIITETGFMSNQSDLSYLIKSGNQTAIGAAIGLGTYWWSFDYWD